MNQIKIRYVLLFAVMATVAMKVTGQVVMPDILVNNSLKEQLNYIDEHTIIYENYRAIREDMFQKIKLNVSDTVLAAKNKIAALNKKTSKLFLSIDSLKTTLAMTKTSLEEMTRTKNSIRVIGLEVNKSNYNKVMWTLLAGLIAVLLMGFIVFKRNLSVTFSTKKEFQELKNEFETYKKTSREAREKLTMDHFKELKKLRGG
ncbi:MAG TPA: hypothetical protein VF346_02555 [Bacteroidales bacterium]